MNTTLSFTDRHWGKDRTFTEGASTIRVVAHIYRNEIDCLTLIDLRGPELEGRSLFAKLAKQYEGRPSHDWT